MFEDSNAERASVYYVATRGTRRVRGLTKPQSVQLDAVLKRDCFEVPHCVYNEWVASRLGAVVSAPVACGGLVVTGDTLSYASVRLNSIKERRGAFTIRQRSDMALKFPDRVAALLGLDILIGNYDRAANFVVAGPAPALPALCGFDHSQALLDCRASPSESLAALESDELLVPFHPFFQLVERRAMYEWLYGLDQIHDRQLRFCCIGIPINRVDCSLQMALADALILRARRLRHIVLRYGDRIFAP